MGLKGLKLDPSSHDLVISGNNLVLIDGDEHIAQKIKCACQTFYGEWWLNVELGLPYFADILVKNPDLSLIRNLYTQVILGVQGVKAIRRLDLSLSSTRELTVSFMVTTENGTASGEIEV